MKKIVFIFSIFLYLLCNNSICQEIVLVDSLKYGKFNVGFKVKKLFDYSRSYISTDYHSDKPNFRPVDMFLWYPSEEGKTKNKIALINYLKYSATDLSFKDKSTISTGSIPLLRLIESDSLKIYLGCRTHASENLKPAKGLFPLIILGQGIYYENPFTHFALCELLASYGFVVVTTPLRGSNSEIVQLNAADLESIIRDLEFLISQTYQLPGVDISKIGLIGFDMGGMAVQVLQMRNSNVKAVLTLDAGIIFQHFSGLPKVSSSFDIEKMTIPWMHITQAQFINPYREYLSQSIWGLAKYSERYLILLNNIEHVNFTSYSLFDVQDGLQNYWSPNALPNVGSYQLICNYSVNFLNTILYDDKKAQQFINTEISFVPSEAQKITLEKKQKEPKPLTIDDLLVSISKGRLSSSIEQILKYAEVNLDWIKYDENQVNFLGYRFITAGDYKTAKEIFELNVVLHPESFNVYDSLGEVNLLLDDIGQAIINYKKSLEINPENLNAKQVLERINEIK